MQCFVWLRFDSTLVINEKETTSCSNEDMFFTYALMFYPRPSSQVLRNSTRVCLATQSGHRQHLQFNVDGDFDFALDSYKVLGGNLRQKASQLDTNIRLAFPVRLLLIFKSSEDEDISFLRNIGNCVLAGRRLESLAALL